MRAALESYAAAKAAEKLEAPGIGRLEQSCEVMHHIAQELEKHAGEELQHALKIAKQIDYLNGEPINEPKEVKVSSKAKDMLKFDLENERVTIVNYRQRIRQADAMGEFALGEVLRGIIAQEQEHLQDLADALGIDTPKIEE